MRIRSWLSALLHPTSIPLRIKRRISQRSLTGLLAEMAGLSSNQSYALLDELKTSSLFCNELGKQIEMIPGIQLHPRWFTEEDWHAALYCVTRAMLPDVVVETGVAAGSSSAFILKALHDNQKGKLYSIDLPPIPEENGNVPGDMNWILPDGVEPGAAVPPSLRYRWELIISPSQTALPPLLQRLGQIDIFLHDSEHSYEHMMWEYETAWPYIKTQGILLSDDVSRNTAMIDFCVRHRHKYIEFNRKVGAVLKKF